MRLLVDSTEVGAIETAIAISPSTEAGGIAIDIEYLLEYFSGRDGPVTMQSGGERSPLVLRDNSLPVVVIMPMVVDWGGPQTQKAEPRVESATQTGGVAQMAKEPEEATKDTGELPEETS